MGDKAKTGFPEVHLEKYSAKLVEAGYKVCVIEHMEKCKDVQKRY